MFVMKTEENYGSNFLVFEAYFRDEISFSSTTDTIFCDVTLYIVVSIYPPNYTAPCAQTNRNMIKYSRQKLKFQTSRDRNRQEL